MILSLICFIIVLGNAHSFFFQGCFVVPNWESMKSKLSDKQNNPRCIEFCREAFFALAATSDTRCVCMDSLPTEVVAFPIEGKAAAGLTSRCNIQCPGIQGTRCDGETCCGGLDNAFSVYATGNIDFVTNLLHKLGSKVDTIMKLFAKRDLPEWSHLQFKIRMTEGLERSCIMTLLQPVTSSQCQKVTNESHIFAPYVEFEVERIEEEAAKSYPTQSHSLDIPGLELNNTGSKKQAKMTRKQNVKATTVQRYTTESGTENSFTIGPSVSAGLKAFESEFSVKLSTECSNSSFYNYAYQSVYEETITDTFEISTTVPAGIRKVVRFAKKFADRTLKWRATCSAKGEVIFFPLSGARNISLSQILTPEERRFYVFGTILGEANPTITAVVYSYDANGRLINTKSAASGEAQPVSSKPIKKKPAKPDRENGSNKDKSRSVHMPYWQKQIILS